MNFDLRTLMLMTVIIHMMSITSFCIVWYYHRKKYDGIVYWILGISLATIGALLTLLREEIGVFLSIYLANILIIVGGFVIYYGIKAFFGYRQIDWKNYVVGLVFAVIYAILTWVYPSLNYRIITIALFGSYVFSKVYLFLHFKVDNKYQEITFVIKILSAAFVLLNIFRAIYTLTLPEGSSIFDYRPIDAFASISYAVFSMLLTTNIIIMVSRRLQFEAESETNKFISAFYSSPYAMIISHLESGTIYEVNHSFEQIFQFTSKEAIGSSFADLGIWSEEYSLNFCIECLQDEQMIQGEELQLKTKDGSEIIGLFSARLIQIGQEDYLLANISDITTMSNLKKELEYLANHDALTGLPNRRYFRKEFNFSVEKQKEFGIILCDLNDFKEINDRYGHDFGDQVLIEIAKGIRQTLEPNGFVSRLGGDEFLTLLPNTNQQSELTRYVDALSNYFLQGIQIEDQHIKLSASIGFSAYPHDGLKIEDLIKKSDIMLYDEKKKHKKYFD